MDKISILMSVYNEKKEDIEEAIFSILKQTYQNIEIIIINDNSERKDIKDIISKFNDSRIIYHVNEKNIGLAMSMNIAAKIATGKYLARMDADDISHSTRLEKQIKLLNTNSIDYVCTWFQFIDENGLIIDKDIRNYNANTVDALLPFCNTIHHPTVLMKREIFDDVGGYRDFPCAQDYDLWLRLHDKGYKVGVVEEILFSYRVRSNSVTSKKRVQQFYTQVYARMLSKERKKNNVDTYSLVNYNGFLKEQGVFEVQYVEKIEKHQRYKEENGKLYAIILILKSKYFRRYYIDGIVSRLIEKWILKSQRKK